MLHFVPAEGFTANSYVYIDETAGQAFAVDCGAYVPRYRELLREAGIPSLTYILLTHGHFDHVREAAALRGACGGALCIHAADEECLSDPYKSLNALMDGGRQFTCRADRLLRAGDRLPFADAEISVLHTPGHTPGSVCFLYKNMLFSGDTLFCMGVGRTDLPGGDTKTLLSSLASLRALEGEYEICPGHGGQTLLSYEKAHNPYLTAR
jgi:glyoxylase-like metal-dependent hydrolase (beta-lactamase superfamily II)